MQLSQGFTAEVKQEEGGDVHGSGPSPSQSCSSQGGGPWCWEGMELQHLLPTWTTSPWCYLAALLPHRDLLCEFLRRQKKTGYSRSCLAPAAPHPSLAVFVFRLIVLPWSCIPAET